MICLTAEDTYRTDLRASSWMGRRFTGTVFYHGVIREVLKGALLARFGNYGAAEWIGSSLGIVRAFERVGGVIHAEGMRALHDVGQPCVFIANHMSVMETFVLPCLIQPWRDVTFVVKKSLLEYPVFRHILLTRRPVAVGRVNPREDFEIIMEQGTERLKKGVSIIVFPQTTRSHSLDEKEFNSVGVKLARRAGAPVIPIALKTDAWGVGRLLKDYGPVNPALPAHFCFGDPISVTGNGRVEHERVIRFITAKLAAWDSENSA